MIEELFCIPLLFIRSQQVALDGVVAKFYGVSTKVLKRAVKANPERFPPSFMFQLTTEEARAANHPRSRPYAFTEQGVLILSSVLDSERADQVNIEIMRTIVRLRERQVIVEVVRKPMRRAVPKRNKIGFLATIGKR